MDIGNRIKQLRIKKSLTLEELASRCELSKGFLSQLERNLTTPSIATLEDITEVLGISLSNFFKYLEDKDDKEIFKSEDFYVDEQEKSTITWLVPNAQKNEMEPILYELNPHSKSFDVLPHEGEEFGFVLRGNVMIINVTKQEEYHLKKGETFYLKGNDEHYIENRSDKIAKFLWICTPPIF